MAEPRQESGAEGSQQRDAGLYRPSKESVWQANRPRSRCGELLVAWIVVFFTFGVTAWILVAITIPLFRNSYIASWYNVLLGVLAAFALLVSMYVVQIGWGAFHWTRKYRKGKDTDWYQKWEEKRTITPPSSSADQMHAARVPQQGEVLEWSDVQHVVIVTAYKEPIEMLQSLAYTLMSQRAAGMCRKQITLVLALEEREGEEAHRKSTILTEELSPFFKNVLSTFHPPDLPGDIKGKASNYKYAVGQVEDFIQRSQEEPRQRKLLEHMTLIHVADADSLYDPNYFPNVTYHFCVDPNRYDYVWQPCMIPTCNFWELAAPCRQVNTMIAAQEMMSANDPLEFQIPFSTYGYALLTLRLIGGTGNAADAQDGDVIAEDHHLFIKGFFALEGRLRVHPIYLPCLNFAVGGEVQSCYKNMRDRYIQAKRHMFGISELFFLVVLLFRGGWCRSRRLGCRNYLAAVNLTYKLLKIHSIPYLGLWVMLGIILTGLLNLDKAFCTHGKATDKVSRVCLADVTQVTQTVGGVCFTVATAFTFAGSFGLLISFVRMLEATHHTLQNIANPTGSFMPSAIFDVTASPAMTPNISLLEAGSHQEAVVPARQPDISRRRRPIDVGGGFPWLGTLLQLFVEFAVLGFLSSLLFGSIPAFIAITLFICKGHRMEYVTAPKPGMVRDEDPREVSDISMPAQPPTAA